MKKELLKHLEKSVLRIIAVLTVILGLPAGAYWLWQPGSDAPLPEFRSNAVWLGHGWLGDDGWFRRNRRDPEDFRNEETITVLFRRLQENKISIVYPHLCPAHFDGTVAACDAVQTERFLGLAEKYGIKVIPWIGGVLGESARPDDEYWRRNFIASVEKLLTEHPRFAGVQINIEPMPSGDADFLRLLDELRPVMANKLLSVAAYPPPTRWHRFPDVHWHPAYLNRVARHCDQLAVMMYDTAIPLEKFYIELMADWTRQAVGAVRPTGCKLLLGIPAYEDADVGYHHPRVENIRSALRGISASDRKNEIDGIAIYCEWEMDETEWRCWRDFIEETTNGRMRGK